MKIYFADTKSRLVFSFTLELVETQMKLLRRSLLVHLQLQAKQTVHIMMSIMVKVMYVDTVTADAITNTILNI